jgi:hypothetical protein
MAWLCAVIEETVHLMVVMRLGEKKRKGRGPHHTLT